MSTKILHVEDSSSWRDLILERIEKAAGDYEVSSFEYLHKAKLAAEENHFDIFICDGTLQYERDGIAWARELHEQGKKVIVVSLLHGTKIPELPLAYDKGDFDSSGFIKAIENLAG